MVFKVIYWLVLSEAVLRCLYWWQLKEYRWDRFWEWLKTGEAGRYFLPGRHWLRPRLTLKIALLFLFALVFSRQFVWWLGYLSVPLTTAFLVAAISPISDLIKFFLVLSAKLKLLFWHRRLLVIGITGSYAKTSTKEILAHILSEKFKTGKTWGTNNTLIGVAKTILFKLPRQTQVFVVEMGAYKIGEISAICRLVRPKIGILTGINQQHLGLFGSQANIVKAKSELLQALPPTGLAVINGINPITKKIKSSQAPVKYYRPGQFKTNLIGVHQQLNIAAAATVAKFLGVKRFNLNNIPHFKTAITKLKGLNGATIIYDSYNANPDGFLAAIELVKTIPAGKKILVSPGIIELGRASEEVHARLRQAAEAVFDQVHITKNETQLLKKLKTMLTKKHLLLIEGRFSRKFIDALCLNPS